MQLTQSLRSLVLFKKIIFIFFLKDHYLAYIELENFGIQKDIPDQKLSVRQVIKTGDQRLNIKLLCYTDNQCDDQS